MTLEDTIDLANPTDDDNAIYLDDPYLGLVYADTYEEEIIVPVADVARYGFDVSVPALNTMIRKGLVPATTVDGHLEVKVSDVARHVPRTLTYACDKRAHQAYIDLMSIGAILPIDALEAIVDGLSGLLETRRESVIIESDDTLIG